MYYSTAYNRNTYYLHKKMRKRTIYIDEAIDRQMRVAAVEDDKPFGAYAEKAFRLFLDKRRAEKRSK